MEHLIIPEDYFSPLSLYDTQVAIKTVKDFFQSVLAKQLNLLRVSSPLFVDPASGMNDNLNGCLLYTSHPLPQWYPDLPAPPL